MKMFQNKKWIKLITYTIAIALTFSLIWLNFLSPFVLVTIKGGSMEPTYSNGSWYLANKKPERLQHGDVIVFQIKNETYIKRIVALEDEEIPISYGFDDGELYASIVPLEYTWRNFPHEWLRIPSEYIWVEGDSINSSGSGRIGMVHMTDIKGVMNYTETPKTFWYSQVVNQKHALNKHIK